MGWQMPMLSDSRKLLSFRVSDEGEAGAGPVNTFQYRQATPTPGQ